MHWFSSKTKVFQSIILLFGPLFEIVDISSSVEVPIGVSHITEKNKN